MSWFVSGRITGRAMPCRARGLVILMCFTVSGAGEFVVRRMRCIARPTVLAFHDAGLAQLPEVFGRVTKLHEKRLRVLSERRRRRTQMQTLAIERQGQQRGLRRYRLTRAA